MRAFGRHWLALKAVDGVSFDLEPGETLGIVGESGCGKSTLGRAVLQLIPPTEGRVLWLGQNMARLEDRAMRQNRRELQIVFQDPLASLDPRMPWARASLSRWDVRAGAVEAEVRDRVREMLGAVGLLPQMINRYPHEFSGGQCQRIGIARAMILRPRLVVCDEPVSALDVSIQAQIINLLMRLQEELGLALIFISHNLAVVRHISQRILVLYLGRMVELADRDSLYDNPRHPYTQALISAVPVPDPRSSGRSAHRAHRRAAVAVAPPSGCVFRTRCPRARSFARARCRRSSGSSPTTRWPVIIGATPDPF